MNNIFHSFWKAIIWKKKKKLADTSFKYLKNEKTF